MKKLLIGLCLMIASSVGLTATWEYLGVVGPIQVYIDRDSVTMQNDGTYLAAKMVFDRPQIVSGYYDTSQDRVIPFPPNTAVAYVISRVFIACNEKGFYINDETLYGVDGREIFTYVPSRSILTEIAPKAPSGMVFNVACD